MAANKPEQLFNVGDLVKHWGKQVGIITHIFPSCVDSIIIVLFSDGEYDVLAKDVEVISESR